MSRNSRWMAALAAGSAVVAGVGLAAMPSQAAVTIPVANACDVLVVGPGAAEGVPGAVEAAPGDTVRLTADSSCHPTFDASGTLLTGDGISIAAEGVTLDLNGHSITSDSNVAAEGDAQGLDVENAGVSVGGRSNRVVNSSAAVASVSNFTANVDFAKTEFSVLRGRRPLDASGVRYFNIQIGNSHGGGGISVDRSRAVTVDTVLVSDANPDGDADNAIDWKRCTGPGNVVRNSRLLAPLSGLRIRFCQGMNFRNNRVTAPGGSGIEITRQLSGAQSTFTGNTIENNLVNGLTVGALSNNISITGNTIRNNGGCGIEVNPATTNIVTAPNTFANNAGGNVC